MERILWLYAQPYDAKRPVICLDERPCFLIDDVAELDDDAQVRLLNLLESGEFRRIGGTAAIRCDVSLLAASRQPLTARS